MPITVFARANHLDLEMKIVVGKADGWQTPILSSSLEAIVFRVRRQLDLAADDN
jgi:murein L,D-transpeptidase YcbB/YkuD